MKEEVKIIQMVPMNSAMGSYTLFIVDFNTTKSELTFRTSTNSKYRQTELIKLDNDLVYTNLFSFPKVFLDNFIVENREHYPHMFKTTTNDADASKGL